ncbi:MAG: histidine kinase [Ignavibacteriales bacterium]|nr:histidine kinase [Ignavibacteriales bacterium]
MKNFLFILFVIVNSIFFAQEKVKVTLELIAPTLDDTTKVFVAGNIEPLGLWRADKIQMKKISKEKWIYEFEIEKGTQVEYKFTKGSWQTEALGNDLSIPRNNILIAEKDTTVSKTILNWRDKFNFKVQGQITGKVEYHKSFVIDGLRPRNIFVWLPLNYDKDKEKRYPVFYMHDGQNLIDPRTSNTFIDWQVDEVADSLIRNGEIEPFILVGINNTDDRAVEYNNTPLGKLYMKLIVEKIKPFIDKTYRTKQDAKNTVVGGSSMGGLISMMCAWEYPDVFSKAACFSPAFRINDIDYVRVVKNYSGEKKNLLLYIDNGGKGLESLLQPGVDSMINALEQKGFEENKDLFVFIDEQAEHNEAAWSKRIWRPLKLFFGKK